MRFGERCKRTIISRKLPLMVICKNRKCGFRHEPELQMDKKDFRIATIERNSEKCPRAVNALCTRKRITFFSS